MVEAEVCAKCSGTGWRHVDKDGISAVERCECLGAQRMANLAERAHIPPHYRAASFDNFTTRPDNPIASKALQNAMTIANSYAREFPMLEKPGLMFIGDPGTGKTHLAIAVAKKLMVRGFECVFFDYQELLERIKGSYDKASGSAQREAFQNALDCEILLLDDLGAHRVSDWVEDTVTSLITYRYNNNKALITTTNLRDQQAGDAALPSGLAGEVSSRYYLAERIGMRARSRLFEMCRVISTRGVEDYRIRRTTR